MKQYGAHQILMLAQRLTQSSVSLQQMHLPLNPFLDSHKLPQRFDRDCPRFFLHFKFPFYLPFNKPKSYPYSIPSDALLFKRSKSSKYTCPHRFKYFEVFNHDDFPMPRGSPLVLGVFFCFSITLSLRSSRIQ